MKRAFFPSKPGSVGAALALGAWLTLLPAPGHAETNAPTGGQRFEDFKVITDRNIFNGNRSGQRLTVRATAPQQPARVDSFTLVGTLTTDGRERAFFDGSQADYRRSVGRNEPFAGFILKEIWPAGVQLETGTNLIALRVGTALRREDEGYWRYAEPGDYGGGAGGGSARSRQGGRSTPNVGGATPEHAEILRRLMEQREKENQ